MSTYVPVRRELFNRVPSPWSGADGRRRYTIISDRRNCFTSTACSLTVCCRLMFAIPTYLFRIRWGGKGPEPPGVRVFPCGTLTCLSSPIVWDAFRLHYVWGSGAGVRGLAEPQGKKTLCLSLYACSLPSTLPCVASVPCLASPETFWARPPPIEL